jgi:hypothetical protein
MKTSRPWFVVVSVLLIGLPLACGLAVLGLAVAVASRPSPAARPVPFATVAHPAPVATQRPAQPATPIQLPTATQPAAIQAPTRPATIQFATATNLPQPTINPTLSAYAAQVLVQIQEYSTALHSFNTLNQRAANDPQLMLNNEWKAEIVAALAAMQVSAERLASIESSAPELSKTRDYFSKIDIETKLLVANYARGIDNLDKDSINAATHNMENINTYILEATKEMQKVSMMIAAPSATSLPTVAAPSGVPRVVPVSAPIPSSPTNTPRPTWTPWPTQTPGPTGTPRPISTTAPTWTPRPTSTPWPTSTTGSSLAAECPCNRGNVLNCPAFSSQPQAQACYLKCGGLSHDVHGLDHDKDGVACEDTPYR